MAILGSLLADLHVQWFVLESGSILLVQIVINFGEFTGQFTPDRTMIFERFIEASIQGLYHITVSYTLMHRFSKMSILLSYFPIFPLAQMRVRFAVYGVMAYAIIWSATTFTLNLNEG